MLNGATDWRGWRSCGRAGHRSGRPPHSGACSPISKLRSAKLIDWGLQVFQVCPGQRLRSTRAARQVELRAGRHHRAVLGDPGTTLRRNAGVSTCRVIRIVSVSYQSPCAARPQHAGERRSRSPSSAAQGMRNRARLALSVDRWFSFGRVTAVCRENDHGRGSPQH
jgi:hypothetical protein